MIPKNWKPMNTAPKDGKPILLAEDNGRILGHGFENQPNCYEGYWKKDELYKAGGYWSTFSREDERRIDPDCWMPLPDFSQTAKTDKKKSHEP